MYVNGVSSLDEYFIALRANAEIKYCLNKRRRREKKKKKSF